MKSAIPNNINDLAKRRRIKILIRYLFIFFFVITMLVITSIVTDLSKSNHLLYALLSLLFLSSIALFFLLPINFFRNKILKEKIKKERLTAAHYFDRCLELKNRLEKRKDLCVKHDTERIEEFFNNCENKDINKSQTIETTMINFKRLIDGIKMVKSSGQYLKEWENKKDLARYKQEKIEMAKKQLSSLITENKNNKRKTEYIKTAIELLYTETYKEIIAGSKKELEDRIEESKEKIKEADRLLKNNPLS